MLYTCLLILARGRGALQRPARRARARAAPRGAQKSKRPKRVNLKKGKAAACDGLRSAAAFAAEVTRGCLIALARRIEPPALHRHDHAMQRAVAKLRQRGQLARHLLSAVRHIPLCARCSGCSKRARAAPARTDPTAPGPRLADPLRCERFFSRERLASALRCKPENICSF